MLSTLFELHNDVDLVINSIWLPVFTHVAPICRSLGFANECLNQHRGGAQRADLGSVPSHIFPFLCTNPPHRPATIATYRDGAGIQDQHFIFRQHYFPIIGTCWESLAGKCPAILRRTVALRSPWTPNCDAFFLGGQHFRAWKQNGSEANTGAWFIAYDVSLPYTFLTMKHLIQLVVPQKRRYVQFTSPLLLRIYICVASKYLGDGHMIVDNGYNIGRDWLVEKAVEGGRWKVSEPVRLYP